MVLKVPDFARAIPGARDQAFFPVHVENHNARDSLRVANKLLHRWNPLSRRDIKHADLPVVEAAASEDCRKGESSWIRQSDNRSVSEKEAVDAEASEECKTNVRHCGKITRDSKLSHKVLLVAL